MNEVIVVERRFAAPAEFPALAEQHQRVAWCLDQHGVTALGSYLATDGTSAVCLYNAPDAEAVRATQRIAGLPVERAWSANVIGELPAPRDRVLVCERTFEQPMTVSYVAEALATRGHCMQLYAVELLATHLALDGRRMICVFAAPDAEAIRTISRGLELPVDRIWAGFAVL